MPVFSQSVPSGTGFARRATTARYCPQRGDADDYRGAFMWYGIPSVPDFDACTYCYNTYIRSAPPQLASAFVPQESDGPEVRKGCDFHFPRTRHMWDFAVQSQNVTLFTEYLQRLMTTSSCPALTGSTPRPGLRWMTLTANQTNPGGPDAVDGFVVCERCYLSIVGATPYTDRLQPFSRAQGPQETWGCDLALPSIEYAFLQASSSNPRARTLWPDVLNAIRTRFAVKPCTGPSGSPEPRQWWTVRPEDSKGLENFLVCDQHYHDCIIRTGRSHEFAQVLRPAGPNELRICDFTTHNINFAWLMTTNVGLSSSYWREAVITTFRTPKCTTNGVTDGEFYALLSASGEPVENTDFCVACYHSYIRPFGPEFERNFTRRTNLPKGTTRLCDLAIGLARTGIYLQKLIKAGVTGDFSVFAEHVAAHAIIPMCPMSKAVRDNRKWYGTDDFLICEECHWDVVRPSSFPYPVSLCFATQSGSLRLSLLCKI